MSNTMQALFLGLVCIVLSLVMWGFASDAEANTDVPVLYKPLYPLFGGVFLIGGLWAMAAGLGLAPSPREVYRRSRYG